MRGKRQHKPALKNAEGTISAHFNCTTMDFSGGIYTFGMSFLDTFQLARWGGGLRTWKGSAMFLMMLRRFRSSSKLYPVPT